MTTTYRTSGPWAAVRRGVCEGILHWRWMLIATVAALTFGTVASLPVVRQVARSLGHHPAVQSTDLGMRLQAWVEVLRSFNGNQAVVGQFTTGLTCALLLGLLFKLWLASGLVASVRAGRPLRFAGLVHAANTGFWLQLKLAVLFVPVFVGLALPGFFAWRWAGGVRKVATAAAQVEQANLVVGLVALAGLALFAVWLELARAEAANLEQPKAGARKALVDGLLTLFQRPFASIVLFLLFFLAGAAFMALMSLAQLRIEHAWLSAACVGIATLVAAGCRAMRLTALAAVARRAD